jgi:hypothetical protein
MCAARPRGTLPSRKRYRRKQDNGQAGDGRVLPCGSSTATIRHTFTTIIRASSAALKPHAMKSRAWVRTCNGNVFQRGNCSNHRHDRAAIRSLPMSDSGTGARRAQEPCSAASFWLMAGRRHISVLRLLPDSQHGPAHRIPHGRRSRHRGRRTRLDPERARRPPRRLCPHRAHRCCCRHDLLRHPPCEGASALHEEMKSASMPPRCFPPPWSVDETDACFIVRDHNGQALT